MVSAGGTVIKNLPANAGDAGVMSRELEVCNKFSRAGFPKLHCEYKPPRDPVKTQIQIPHSNKLWARGEDAGGKAIE